MKRKPIRCYDNKGETFDRYTVIFTKQQSDSHGNKWFNYLAMSEHPFHPQGFGQHGEMKTIPPADCYDSGFGVRIPFSKLPVDCQKLVLSELKG